MNKPKNKVLLLSKIMFATEDLLGVDLAKGSKVSRTLKLIGVILLLILAGVAIMPLFLMMSSPEANNLSLILRLILLASSLMSFLFGFFYVISIFYFSSDIENYLVLPVTPGSLVLSKFLTVLVLEIINSLILFLPSVVAIGLDQQASAIYFVGSFLGLVLVPIIPLALSAIISILIMRFSKIFHNKDQFTMISSVLGVLLMVAFSTFMQSVGNGSAQGIQPGGIGIDPSTPMGFVSTFLFPGINLMGLGSFAPSATFLLKLALTILLSLIAMAIAYEVGNRFYLDGALGIKESGSKRKRLSNKELSQSIRGRGQILAYADKEMKTLLRTPAYFINCVLMNFLMPLFFILPVIFNPTLLTFFKQLLSNPAALWSSVPKEAIILGVASLVTLEAGMNSIAVTAITREGSNFFLLKTFPMSYLKQFIAKLIPAFLIQALSLALILIPLVIFVKPPLVPTLLGLLLGFLVSLFIQLLLLLLDVIRPNLEWTTEQKAVKQSFNAFIGVFGTMGIVALPFILMSVFELPLVTVIGLMFIIGALGSILILALLPSISEKSFAKRS